MAAAGGGDLKEAYRAALLDARHRGLLPSVDKEIQQSVIVDLIGDHSVDERVLLQLLDRGLIPLTFPRDPQPFSVALNRFRVKLMTEILRRLPDDAPRGSLGDISATIFLAHARGTRLNPDLVTKFIRINGGIAPTNISKLPETSTYRQFITKERNSANLQQGRLRAAQDMFRERGPICSSEGFYQHSKECWNDTVMMFFCYAKGIGPVVQEKLLFKTNTEILSESTVADPALVGKMSVYLNAMRNRLVRATLNEDLRRFTCSQEEIDMESLVEVSHGPERGGGLNSATAALFGVRGVNLAETLSANYWSIARGSSLFHILPILIDVFNLSKVITFEYHRDAAGLSSVTDDTAAVGLVYSRVGSRTSHITGFLTCGEVDYYYDNQSGIFRFPWRDLIATHLSRPSRIVIKRLQFNTIPGEDPGMFGWPCLEYKLDGEKVLETYEPTSLNRMIIPIGTKRFFKSQVVKIDLEYRTVVHEYYILNPLPGVVGPEEKKYRPYLMGRGRLLYPFPASSSSEQRERLREVMGVENLPPLPEAVAPSNFTILPPDGTPENYGRYEANYRRKVNALRERMRGVDDSTMEYARLRRTVKRMQRQRTKNLAGRLATRKNSANR